MVEPSRIVNGCCIRVSVFSRASAMAPNTGPPVRLTSTPRSSKRKPSVSTCAGSVRSRAAAANLEGRIGGASAMART